MNLGNKGAGLLINIFQRPDLQSFVRGDIAPHTSVYQLVASIPVSFSPNRSSTVMLYLHCSGN